MENIFDLISRTADGVLAVDRDQKIVLWNDAAEQLLGFKTEEALGRYCYDVIGGRDDSGRVVCGGRCLDLMRALRQERVPTHDLLVRTRAGRNVWVSVSTVLVPSKWKDLCVLIHLFRDISQQKELEHFVQQLLASVKKLSLPEGTSAPISLAGSLDLSRREREVLRLLASGASTSAVAKKLFISPATARNHIHNLIAKLGVHSRLEAVTLALRHSLL